MVLFQPITWKKRGKWGHLRTPWYLRGTPEERKNLQILESRITTDTPPISQFPPDGSRPWESDLRTASRRNSCSAKLLGFLLKSDSEVVLKSKKASVNPASLAPTSLRQAGYYYYLFVDGYSKPSVRSSPRPGSRGAKAVEISFLVPRAAWELRVIKVHFAIANCSVRCLTLHLTSGFCCPYSTGNRKSYKLQRGTPEMNEEEVARRKRMLGLVEMGILYLCFIPSLP